MGSAANKNKDESSASDSDTIVQTADGASSPQAADLRKAAEDCVMATRDHKYFVNESEAVLARFDKALRAFIKKGFADESAVLESIENKDLIVKFLMDCVRNRFLAWRLVSGIKSSLISGRPGWKRAFDSYSGPAVDLSTAPEKKPPPPPPDPPARKRPIPFLIELLALLALALPFFSLLQGCNCNVRYVLFILGLLMLLPILIFELLWCCRCGGLVYRLSIGDYVPKLQAKKLGYFWWPSMTVCERPPAWPVDDSKGTCMSFGQWWCAKLTPDATVIAGTADDGSKAGICSCRPCGRNADSESEASDGSDTEDGGYRRASRRPRSVSSIDSARGDDRRLGKLVLSSSDQPRRAVDLYGDGTLVGLPQWVEFDGNSIFFSGDAGRGEQHWGKVDCCRLEFCRKAWCSIAALGLLMSIVSAAFPPGIFSQCGPITLSSSVKLPLEVYFMLDASSSVGAQEWISEKAAAKSIYTAFADVYAPSTTKVHVGIGQFATTPSKYVEITNNLPTVTSALQTMPQQQGGTAFKAALELCNRKLVAYQPPGGGQTYQVCVLITDGQNTDGTAPVVLRGLLPGIKLMGIYVGNIPSYSSALRSITSCFGQSANCPWFIDAANFQQLQSKAQQVAQQVTSQVQTNTTNPAPQNCDRPLWTALAMPFFLPFLIWWLYLRIDCFAQEAPKPQEDKWKHKDPDRLRVAGANAF